MSRRSISRLAATALTVAATAPAVALAADVELKGSPSLTQFSTHTATLMFTTKEALPRKNGGPAAKVRFGDRIYRVGTSSHEEHKYFARLKRSSWTRGATYRVRILVGDQSIPRRVILK